MLKEKIFNAYKFPNHDNNNVTLLLWNGFYRYGYVDDSIKKFMGNLDETSLSESHSNMEDITDANYAQAKRNCRNFEIKTSGEYHDLHVQRNKLLLAGVVENFRNMFLKIYEIYPAKIFSTAGLAWQAALKKTKVKLDLLRNIDVLLKVENDRREGTCHFIYWYAKTNSKCMKDYDKNKESSYLKYSDANNLYGWTISQKLPVNNFERMKDTFQFNKEFSASLITNQKRYS